MKYFIIDYVQYDGNNLKDITEFVNSFGDYRAVDCTDPNIRKDKLKLVKYKSPNDRFKFLTLYNSDYVLHKTNTENFKVLSSEEFEQLSSVDNKFDEEVE